MSRGQLDRISGSDYTSLRQPSCARPPVAGSGRDRLLPRPNLDAGSDERPRGTGERANYSVALPPTIETGTHGGRG